MIYCSELFAFRGSGNMRSFMPLVSCRITCTWWRQFPERFNRELCRAIEGGEQPIPQQRVFRKC